MSVIAERIRSFRNDRPLPKKDRKPLKKEEFWWLDNQSSSNEMKKEFNNGDDNDDGHSTTPLSTRLSWIRDESEDDNEDDDCKNPSNADIPRKKAVATFDNLPLSSSSSSSSSPSHPFPSRTETNTKELDETTKSSPFIDNILQKEIALTKYLDSHLDNLFDRVDNILEEFGMSSSLKINQDIPKHMEQSVDIDLEQGKPYHLHIEEITNPLDESTLESLPELKSKYSSIIRSTVHSSVKSDQGDTNLEHTNELLEEKQQLSSKTKSSNVPSTFFYLSSSFESEAGFPSDKVIGVNSDTIVKETMNSSKVEPLSEEEIQPFLNDEIIKTMWNRVIYLRQLLKDT